MAVIKIVPKEHWTIIQEYLDGENAVVLVPEDNLNNPEKFSAEKAQLIRESDGKDVDYDFGGEADCWVDTCSTDEHFLMDCLNQ